jgi:hypothetical protein
MARFALIVLAVASPVLLIALLVGGETAGRVFALVSPLVPVALMALVEDAQTKRVRHVVFLGLLLLTLELGTVGILLRAGPAQTETFWFDLPLSTVLMLVALGLVPLLLVPAGYAALFVDDPGRRATPRR